MNEKKSLIRRHLNHFVVHVVGVEPNGNQNPEQDPDLPQVQAHIALPVDADGENVKLHEYIGQLVVGHDASSVLPKLWC